MPSRASDAADRTDGDADAGADRPEPGASGSGASDPGAPDADEPSRSPRSRRAAVLLAAALVLLLVAAAALIVGIGTGRSERRPVAAPSVAPVRLTPEGTFEGRPYRLFLPAGRPERLVVALHPLYGNVRAFEDAIGLDPVAARSNWAVLYPSGFAGSWNAGTCCGRASREHIDDVGYVDRLIRFVRAHLDASTPIVDLLGHSNGGMLALTMACRDPSAYSAVAVVAANLQTSDCVADPPPFLIVRGAKDATVPVAGGSSRTIGADLLPDRPGLALLTGGDACRRSVDWVRYPYGFSFTYGCGPTPAGVYLVLTDQGHGYPSSSRRSPIDATSVAARFFVDQRFVSPAG